jgi:hypothetical protein
VDVAGIFSGGGCGINVAANTVVDGVIRGAWLVVADGLAAWLLASLVRGTIHKLVQVHLLPQIMVQPG